MPKRKFVGVQMVETVRDGNRTFAFGIYQDHKIGRVPFVGLAEKNPEDKENESRGRNFAVGRAFQNLGSQIEKAEWKRLKPKRKRKVNKKKFSPQKIAKLRKEAMLRDMEEKGESFSFTEVKGAEKKTRKPRSKKTTATGQKQGRKPRTIAEPTPETPVVENE